MSGDVDIDAWLVEHGLGLPAAKAAARAALEAAGLTRAGKARMSVEKLPRAAEVLYDSFFLHCARPECEAFARASGKVPLRCEPRTACQRCGGSDNACAAKDVLEACARHGVTRVVIVGGSPAVREELERLLGAALRLRLIDGTRARLQGDAKADLDWADVVLLWGATELHHKVSNQYQDGAHGPLKRKLVHVPRRGIAQLLAGLRQHLDGPGR